jgi:hypothetical protein
VHSASLPAGAGHDRCDGLLEAGVGVRDDQLHPGQPAGLQAAEERRPEGAILAVADVQAQHLSAAVGGHAGGDHDRAAHHPAVHAGLEVGGVQEQVREAGVGQRARAERGDLAVQLDPRGAELLFQVITEREERASIAIGTNLPFSEWGTVFPDPRLVAAIVDRVTFNAHIVETGTQSYRLATSKTSNRKRAS